MQPTIRDFTPADYPAFATVHNMIYYEYPDTAEEFRFNDERRDAKCKHRRWVAEREGEIVAAAEYDQSASHYHPRKFSLGVLVHPEQQGQGIGTALFDTACAALEAFEPVALKAFTREDMERSVRFLARRGFQERLRDWESRLDVAAFDPSPYDGAVEKVLAQGIAIRTFAELAADPERDLKLWELHWLVEQDMPSAEAPTRTTLEHFRSRWLEDPNFLAEACFIATDGAEYVGLSDLVTRQGTTDLYTGTTGVVREYRRRGIALALKLRAIAWARERGYPLIKTWNNSGNRAMLSINERLGFVKQPAWVQYEKVLREE
jgi:GNAT superfamily N-acetyltransferase